MTSAGPRVPGTVDRPAISVQGLAKAFEGAPDPVTALDGVELTVAPGDFLSLIGPSGCGKTTLLRIIADLVQPTVGQVRVNGKPAHQARLDRDYGMVFQAPVLMDWRTVARNVELPLEIMGVDRVERMQRSADLLHLVELDGFGDRHPWQLSGGMQQRVAIARALAPRPGLLLMDEPFGALDEMTRERLNLELTRTWAQTGTTVIFVTHSISEAVFLSTRVAVMSARPGRIMATVEIDLPRPRSAATRESTRFFDLLTEIRGLLHAGAAEVVERPVGSA
ncbi:MAG TPA: ABC transporter ATP-binding protein [Candidatus Limnocylindrales bacterium]